MSESEEALLYGKFPDIKKMKKADLLIECQMWRNIWQWVPSEVKYYVSRTGTRVGFSIRNYHRFIGVLLDTRWDLKSVEAGVYEKVYDQNDGTYYFERKIIKIPVGQIVSWDWIKERKTEKEMLKEAEAELELPSEET